MNFEATTTVRFADCDPAGIVFFPQYLVMMNTFVERWFDESLHVPYAQLLGARRTGLPTVRLEVDFTAVSRHGDVLTQRLQVERAGRSSLVLAISFSGGDELRLRARQVLVCTSLDTHRAQPLPEDVRAALAPYVLPGEGASR
jgi:4-hydroxybenzoyl-CoA thioesterase